MGRPLVLSKCSAALQPLSVNVVAQSVPSRALRNISWHEETNKTLSGCFAAVRVRHAGGNVGKARLRSEP